MIEFFVLNLVIIMNFISMAFFLFLVSACTHNPNDVVAVDKGGKRFYTDDHAAKALAQGDDESVVCERRVITGSHRVTRVCTTKQQKQKEREESRELHDRIRSNAINQRMGEKNN
ncbi:hypothetical protein [Marinicella pacifica]|uniref:hypothetical protein n=1 Tax=Marinicella pacifica TaxID=1171543 RepID=UPI0031EEC27B